MKPFILPEKDRDAMIERMTGFLRACLPGKRVKVTIEKYVKRRTLEQSAYLWGYVYPTILKEGGEELAGWTAEDLHKVLLAKHFGAETLRWGGVETFRPLRTSSKLTTVEFSEYVAFIQQFCAELGIYIDEPTDMRHD